MNEKLRDALHRAASGEPAVGDAYARFEIARRRANIVRTTVIIAITIAVAASFVYVLPNPFRTGDPAPLQGGGDLNPRDSFVNRYQDPVVGFELNYPLAWEGTGSPGETAIFASPGEGDVFDVSRCERCSDVLIHPTRFVIRLEPVRRINTLKREGRALASAGADVSYGESFEASGRPVAVADYVFPAERSPAFEGFCIGCSVTRFVVGWQDGWFLDVMAMAPDAATLELNRADARHLVTTIQRLIERPFED